MWMIDVILITNKIPQHTFYLELSISVRFADIRSYIFASNIAKRKRIQKKLDEKIFNEENI